MNTKILYKLIGWLLGYTIICYAIYYFGKLIISKSDKQVIGTSSLEVPTKNDLILAILAAKIDESDYKYNTVINHVNTVNVFAGSNMSGGVFVVIIDNKAYPFNCQNVLHFDASIGYLASSCIENSPIVLFVGGIVVLPYSLTINTKYFVGNQGDIIDYIPDNFGIQSCGYAISENQLLLDFSTRISL